MAEDVSSGRRALGLMVTYGYPTEHLETDLAIARRLGAERLEILPDWRAFPDPAPLRRRIADAGFQVHSVHGCWGGQAILADRVDLGSTDGPTRDRSVDDLRRCLDWLVAVEGAYLVVHPGGLSDPTEAPERREALAEGLAALAAHAAGTAVVVCVENMPPGVHPGSSMIDLGSLLDQLACPRLALALDTGHAQLVSSPEAETLAAGLWLKTTHVHDNHGRQDTHEPPGQGVIDWDRWLGALDRVGYTGPIVLECIRKLREEPGRIDDDLLRLVRRLSSASG